MIRTKIQALIAQLACVFVEREAVIRGLVLATLAQEHVLLLGPPGTGKSSLARAFCAALEGRYFEWLLTRFSPPEELFGPVSLSGLKEDRFVRVVDGKLPTADVAFLDEIFKANGAILNSLLAVANERVFHDEGKAKPIPLLTMIGASNELPESEELAALWDRFLVRFWVRPVQGEEAWKTMIRLSRSQAGGPATGGPASMVTTRIPVEEWRTAQAEVATLPVSDEALGALDALRRELAQSSITPSDRRWCKVVNLAAASAWLDGEPEVTSDAFPALGAALWERAEQEVDVRKILARHAAPEVARATELHDAIFERLNNLPAKGSPSWEKDLASSTREANRAVLEISKLYGSASSARNKTRIGEMGTAVKERARAIRAQLLDANDLDVAF